MLSTCVINAQSQNNEYKVLFQTKKITDMNQIEERMNKGITDDKEFKVSCVLSTTITGGNKDLSVEVSSVKATSQKIMEMENGNGDIVTEYSANIIANLSPLSEGGGTEEPWQYDDPIGCNAKVYVNVTYLTGTLDGFPLYKITTLKGKLEKLDSSISLSRIDITEQAFGTQYTSVSSSGRVGSGQYNITATANSPSNNTYYYNNNLSPYYWNMADGTVTYLKGITTGYFARAGSSWSAQVIWER